MMKRFGIVGMGMFGMMTLAGYLEGEPDATAAAAAADADAIAAPAKASTKLDAEAPAAAAPKEQPGDAEILDKAGYAPAEGDPGLTYAMKFLATNGFKADNQAVEAAFDGDFSLLKAELAQKGIAGWEQALGLAEQSYDRHVKANEAKGAEVGKVVTGIAESMGVDWEQAVAHVSKTASAEEKTAINSLLSDPKTAHIAARFINGSFIESGETEIEPAAKAVGAETRSHNGPAGGALSRAEYNAELGKLRKTLGDDYINSPQAAALYRRLR
jgi:hypothetical protein